MNQLTSTSSLQLHLVPAGRRLDFTPAPGCFAYVYRRCQLEGWQCIAQNARSPFLDTSALPLGTAPEYVVQYQNGAGALMGATPIVQAHPLALPVGPSWVSLR
ncbi:hypothetical protein DNI29_10470 [Hymenobacter sediminis]|uniref:hypothetical protein n=1 Tax=Hymenobacter sediminis TaxID=2218621 RepID=UPI000F516A6A|nr:hypothetical protein [Hymenobacter sediminis]RPD47852.1 hypothetical protein DNI29_10470 [Hymenobacter sediminis]